MHPLESRVKRLLWYVKEDEWERPAALLTLLGGHAGPWPIELSRDLLAELTGRSHRQAAYDHDVLVEMAKDHVLVRWRGRGRQADVWRINPQIRRWLHVPWVTRRSDAIRDLGGPLWTCGQLLTTVTPGQSVALTTGEGGQATPPKKLTRTFTPSDLSSKVVHMSSNANRPGETGVSHVVKWQDPSGATPLTHLSDNPSLPKPPNDSEEGVSEGISSQEVRKRTWQMKEHLDPALTKMATQRGLPPVAVEVGSTMWKRVWGVAEKYEGDPAILLARCDSFADRMFSLQRALDELEMWVAAGPTVEPRRPVKYLEESAANLRRLIATYRRSDPNDEHIPDMEARLHELEEQLAVTADG